MSRKPETSFYTPHTLEHCPPLAIGEPYARILMYDMNRKDGKGVCVDN
jgi:hypothetical protein